MDISRETNGFERLVVLLDPSSPAGESGADLARSLVGHDGHLELAVALTGPEAWPFQAFADSEELPIKEAASIYLEQAAERLGHDRVSTTLVDGADLTADLVSVVEESDAHAVVAPAVMAARAMASKGAWATLPFPVLVVPGSPVAA